MKKWLLKLSLTCCVFLFCSVAYATPVVPNDTYWSLDNPSAGVTFSLLSENAGYADINAFGLYQIQSGVVHPLYYEVFAGVDSPWMTKTVTGGILAGAGFSLDGEFGFYIDSSAGPGGGIFLSDPFVGHDNNGVDYMHALFHNSKYILAFEDLMDFSGCGEPDYNDIVVKVSGMTPTPIPGALFLLLGGIPFVFRKRM